MIYKCGRSERSKFFSKGSNLQWNGVSLANSRDILSANGKHSECPEPDGELGNDEPAI